MRYYRRSHRAVKRTQNEYEDKEEFNIPLPGGATPAVERDDASLYHLLVNPITKSSKPDEITAAYDIRNKNLIVARICACPDTRESLDIFLAIPTKNLRIGSLPECLLEGLMEKFIDYHEQ